jgi:DNA-binding HxlR family transcriptional regulator
VAKRIRFSKRSICPVANTLDLIGDKWTLLVVRDMLLLGKHRFGELLGSDEGIPTNILTDRLRRLEKGGILRKRAYSRQPTRYEYRLTTKGTELFPILREMVRWANRHIGTTAVPPPGWLEQVAKAAADEAAAEEAARARPSR